MPPGLTFPRILSLIINEAARSLEEGVASAEEIDIAMRLGVNYPQGPLSGPIRSVSTKCSPFSKDCNGTPATTATGRRRC